MLDQLFLVHGEERALYALVERAETVIEVDIEVPERRREYVLEK